MRIEEITIFLSILSNLKQTKKTTLLELVEFKDISYRLQINSNLIFNLCKRLKLIEEKNRRVVITNYGMDIIDMQENKVDLTKDQNNYIAEKCVINNSNFKQLNEFFREIPYNSQLKRFGFKVDEMGPKLSKSLSKLPKSDFSILTQLEILEKSSDFWLIAKDYQPILEMSLKKNKRQITPEQLEKILKEQKRIGALAETLTLDYEKKYLRKKKWDWQSNHLVQKSKDFTNAGYDIESYYTKNKKSDKFIEVKGRKRRENSFIISVNEIQVASEKGQEYVIYFWNNLGSKIPPKKPVRIIRNPHKELSLGKCKNCLSYLVELD